MREETAEKPAVALVTLGDSRREFYQQRIAIVQEEMTKARAALEKAFSVYQSPIVSSDAEAEAVAAEIRRRGIQAVVIHLPIWGTPALALRIAQSTPRPVALLANTRKDSSSLVVMLAVAGMLDQSALPCIRIAGDVADAATCEQLTRYIRACALVEGVRKSEYCMVGGRSIGIGTTVADPSQWARVFGTAFDHADQFEVYLRAGQIDPARVARHLDWWKARVNLEFGGRFTPESLERQMRSYLALRDMAGERGYDFLGLKCQQEMSDHYALQCVAVALLNNDCDADGPKTPIPTACECDCDGALTMRILSLASGGAPSCLVDIKFFGEAEGGFTLANCGAMAPYFADPAGGCYKTVTMLPHTFGLAGGGATQMIAAPGPVTVARLFRSRGEYVLGCFEGRTVLRPREELRKTTWCYPHQFIEAQVDYDLFLHTMNANHLHSVYGNYAGVLRQFCEMVGIRFINYNK